MSKAAKHGTPALTKASWAVLCVLLALLIAGAATSDRTAWPSFMGDEATYLMQAESLAWDFDLYYSAADYHRFVDHWQRPPQGLILQSGDGGEHITYGKPFFYALYVAPFLRLSPVRGPFLANALLLAAACLIAARALERRLGPAAPLWVTVLVFGSVTFVFTFWAHADLFMTCLVGLALALIPDAGAAGEGTRGWSVGRWLAVGALLAVVGFSRPLYLTLFLPVLVALPRPRLRRFAAVAASAVALTLLTASVHLLLTGSWTGYGAMRTGFYAHTGYPEVDFPASQWSASLDELGNAAAVPPEVILEKKMTPALAGWSAVYFLVGRHVGVVPYFLPCLLLLAGRPRGFWSLSLLAAVIVAAAAFLLLRPFNFYGGGGTIANRYFLPLYPALWFVPTRLPRPPLLLAAGLAAGLFLAPLWLHPRTYPLTEGGTYAYVTPVARRLLPFETTQSHLKLAGREDLYPGFYVRVLSPSLRTPKDAEGALQLTDASRGEVLVGSINELPAIDLLVRSPVDVRVELVDGRVEPLERNATGARFRLHLPPAAARHPMWWSWERAYLYELTLDFPDAQGRPVTFELTLPR